MTSFERVIQASTGSGHAGQYARTQLRTTQERQTQMHRFHLRPDRYLSGLEARWDQLTSAP